MTSENNTGKPAYLEPGSTQTLRDALDEYYACNPGLLDPSQLDDDIRELFRQHDAGHVVFGCDTSLRGETLIDTWTVFGSSAGLKGYMKYFEHSEVNNIFKDVGFMTITVESTKALPDAVLAIARGISMKRKWPWTEFENYLDRTLVDIRGEFGIQVI